MMTMDLFVHFTLFITCMFLPPGMRGQPPEKSNIFSKLTRNLADQLYVRSLGTDSVSCRGMCAMGCNLDEMCTLFQFKDGQCQLFKKETGPGMGITSLTSMTDIWSVDIGKATTEIRSGQLISQANKQIILVVNCKVNVGANSPKSDQDKFCV